MWRQQSFMNLAVRACTRPSGWMGRRLPSSATVTTTSSGKNVASNWLEGDAGPLATRVHHIFNTSLTVLTPLLFIMPDAYTDGFFNKTLGVLLAVNVTAHSWIGLNYVATDYVPKISKALLGPARWANAGMAAVTLLGMTKMALTSPGGIKGVVKGVWNPKPKKDPMDF